MKLNQELIASGLKHVASHARADDPGYVPEALAYIAEGRGNRSACLRGLEGLHEAKSSYAWFGLGDLAACKQHAYTATKIHCINAKEFGIDFMRVEDFFWALLSDHAGLIDWCASMEPNSYWIKYLQKPNHFMGSVYQLNLAVRGDWEPLRQRAEQLLEIQPPKLKKYLVDQRFYLALANADMAGMQEALTELTSPKMARLRNDELGFAFTAPFIGTHATTYAKIAWRHGFKLQVDTPYIPAEFLPVQALGHYEDPYPFMQVYPV